MLRPLSDHARDARLRLLKAGIPADEARLDAELLARHLLGWDRARYIAYQQQAFPERSALAYEALVTRRERREPLFYILGTREFFGRDFEVTKDVLIPRPETEHIVEVVLELVRTSIARDRAARATAAPSPFALRLADVGTGSGCLAVTLAAELPEARVVAFDVSSGALDVARRNATRHGVTARVTCVERDLWQGLQHAAFDEIGPLFDLVVSNPPYVPHTAVADLAPEVRDHEPAIALVAGDDGLDLIRILVPSAEKTLRPGGWLVFEIGSGQAEAVRAVVEASGFDAVRIEPDLQGIPRTVVARRPTPNGPAAP